MTPRRIVLATALFVATFAAVRAWDFVLTPPIGHARYQAVFLTNGQTYFGRYFDRLGPYVKVEDAFYIQQQPKQQEGQQDPDLKLVRRGSELHQPDPEMLIPKDAILFVEDLRPDSQVAQFMERNGR
jgi:hypothetical protein